MCSLREKNEDDLAEWLKEAGFNERFSKLWHDSCISQDSIFFLSSENGVDGESFLLFTDSDVKEMIKPVGI